MLIMKRQKISSQNVWNFKKSYIKKRKSRNYLKRKNANFTTAKYKNEKIVTHQAKAYADGEDGT